MNDGTFELNEIGWYTPLLVEENKWLNDKQTPADLAKFGKNYSVVFEGDAQSYLWTAKNAPEIGKKYWGHLQATSGKSIRFKTDKQEDAPQTGQSPSQGSYESHSDKEDSIARAVALKGAVEFVVGNGNPELNVLEVAELYLAWLKNDSGSSPHSGTQQGMVPTPTPEPSNTGLVTPAATKPPGSTGYSKAKQARAQLDEPLPEAPADLQWIQEGAEYDD